MYETETINVKFENQKKKEYLLRYQKCKVKVERIDEQLKELKLNEIAPGLTMNGMPSAHRITDLSDYMAKYDELYARLISAKTECIKAQDEIQQSIERMEDELEKAILIKRYLRGYGWEQIAMSIPLSVRHTLRIHGDALKHFEPKKDVIECH